MNEQIRLMTNTKITDAKTSALVCPNCGSTNVYYDPSLGCYKCKDCCQNIRL